MTPVPDPLDRLIARLDRQSELLRAGRFAEAASDGVTDVDLAFLVRRDAATDPARLELLRERAQQAARLLEASLDGFRAAAHHTTPGPPPTSIYSARGALRALAPGNLRSTRA
jgi:hypothetical protein